MTKKIVRERPHACLEGQACHPASMWIKTPGDAMSYMIEVFYSSSVNKQRDNSISDAMELHDGVLTYREAADNGLSGSVCLTYEFASLENAQLAAADMIKHGEPVEGPYSYGE